VSSLGTERGAHAGPQPETGGESPIAALLTPSLSSAVIQPLYSVRALFLTAFFAGGAAGLWLSYLNARRLHRQRTDAVYLLLLGAVWLAFHVDLILLTRDSVPFGASWGNTGRSGRTLTHLAAVLVAGVALLPHRPFHRAMQVAGTSPASPWKAVLASCAVGLLADAVVLGIARML